MWTYYFDRCHKINAHLSLNCVRQHFVQFDISTQSIAVAPGRLLWWSAVAENSRNNWNGFRKIMFSVLIILLLTQYCRSEQILGEFLSYIPTLKNVNMLKYKIWFSRSRLYPYHNVTQFSLRGLFVCAKWAGAPIGFDSGLNLCLGKQQASFHKRYVERHKCFCLVVESLTDILLQRRSMSTVT